MKGAGRVGRGLGTFGEEACVVSRKRNDRGLRHVVTLVVAFHAAAALGPLPSRVAAAPGPLASQEVRVPPPPPEWPAGTAVDDSPARAVDRLFARWDRPGSPGAAVGVFRDGKALLARGYGSASLDGKRPIGPSTGFHAASVSKQFTAYAIALLAERGALSLDDEVRRHLPEVPDFGEPITLRHLLHHTSGLRDQWALLVMAGYRLDDPIGQEDVLQLVRRQQELNFSPGTEHLYSNTGYTLLAEVVERVTGRPFAAWIREQLFLPLGMERTRFRDGTLQGLPSPEGFASPERRAESYEPVGGGKFRHLPLNLSTVGATGLQTTVEDLGRWAAHLDDPGAGDHGIRGAEGAVRRMEERGVLVSGETLAYAFGQSAASHRGHRVLEHGGADAGFRSYLLRFPDERLAVVILANDGSMDVHGLARRVADLYLPGRVRTPTGARTAASLQAGGRERAENRGERRADVPARTRRPGAERTLQVAPWDPTPAELRGYAGVYRSEELDIPYTLGLDAQENFLLLHHPRHGAVRLVPLGKDLFAVPASWVRMVRFLREGEDGPVVGFRATTLRVRDLLFQR